jgi:WD40 repeat protein
MTDLCSLPGPMTEGCARVAGSCKIYICAGNTSSRGTSAVRLYSGIHSPQHSGNGYRDVSVIAALQIMLWNFPDPEKPTRCIQTRHDLNIFGVEFLPGSNSTKIITSAFDRTVQLHDISRSSGSLPGSSAGQRRSAGTATGRPYQNVDLCFTTVYHNHSESVKVRHTVHARSSTCDLGCTASAGTCRACSAIMAQQRCLSSAAAPPVDCSSLPIGLQDVAVAPGNAHCFWSAAEDGRVHQFDVRVRGDAEPDARNMLIRSPDAARGRQVEFKSLDIDKVRAW